MLQSASSSPDVLEASATADDSEVEGILKKGSDLLSLLPTPKSSHSYQSQDIMVSAQDFDPTYPSSIPRIGELYFSTEIHYFLQSNQHFFWLYRCWR